MQFHICLCRPETNIKPWNGFKKDLKEGNYRTKWIDREPYAYWKGNVKMGVVRKELFKCRNTDEQDWNARLYIMVTNLHDSAKSFQLQYYINRADSFRFAGLGSRGSKWIQNFRFSKPMHS